jgi:hypothetical protein
VLHIARVIFVSAEGLAAPVPHRGRIDFAAVKLAVPLLSLASAAGAAGLAFITTGSADRFLLVLAQTFGVVWLFLEGWGTKRHWVSATCVLAGAWIPLFLVSSWVFTLDPPLLAGVASSPEHALVLLNITLFAVIGSWLGVGGREAISRARSRIVHVDSQHFDQTWFAVWLVTGTVGVAAFMFLAGGPSTYLTHLDQAGVRSSGFIYVVWLGLSLKYAGLTKLAHYWASGQGRGRNVLLLCLGIVVLLGLFGQRAFFALVFVQAVLLYALIKRPLSMTLIAPSAVFVLAVITFGIGTVKRYQGYNDTAAHQKLGFIKYVETKAPHEFVRAYVDNYADGVRLVAWANALVPGRARYEKGRGFIRLALQPIPSAVRPEVHVAKPLRPLLESSGGYGYALPIPLVGYVEFGLVGVVLGGALLGLALALTDRGLSRDRQELSRLLVLTALVVEIPFCLRSSVPRGVSFAALDLLGMFVVAKSCLRGSAARERPEEAPFRSASTSKSE